ncbi:MAG TPA: PilT/PilU family type 4a pilus ATPase [Phycisphaerae bacterium]|nr:PilT/PilU family type 4a pilus ATPase [Phycisphaerae bacterium]
MSVHRKQFDAANLGGSTSAAVIDDLNERASGLDNLLRMCVDTGASDLLIVAGVRPMILTSGNWRALPCAAPTADELLGWFSDTLTTEQMHRLQEHRDLDFGLGTQDFGRFRINMHYQRGAPAAAIRSIPNRIPAFADLQLPPQVLTFADFASGLVLVTGGTGQGKSTTLAAMIDHVNQTRCAHIITVEDPLEFDFQNDKSIIEQREIGDDSPSFASALRHVLRQRPDVILIGEMRDLETISTALTAAETGHLVLATLHTSSAVQTVARIVDVFPPAQQAQVRTQLAASLRAIVCQRLLKDQLSDGLVPATEIMLATTAIRRNIRENESHLVNSSIETGRRLGMHTMEQSLVELTQSGRASVEDAIAAAPDAARIRTMLGVGAE